MTRTARVAGAVLATLLLCCACGAEGQVTLKPWLVPIELSLNTNGDFQVTKGFEVATPLGPLEFSGSLTSNLADGHTLLEIDYPPAAGRSPTAFDLAEDGSAAVCLDGRFAMSVSSDRIRVGVLSDTSRIAIVDSSTSAEQCGAYQSPAISSGDDESATSFDASGTWEGTYVCNQGLTGVTLTVSMEDSAVGAVFDFYAAPDGDPSVPSGSFTMTGSAGPNGIQLTPDE